MDSPPLTHAPKLYCVISEAGKGGSKAQTEDLGNWFTRFEWASFLNSGYIIRARIKDPHWDILKKLAVDYRYLYSGKRKPVRCEYELSWPSDQQQLTTGRHIAYVTDVDGTGIPTTGHMEFIAIDPPSYWLNAGDSAGRMYKGKLTTVIKQVVNDYFIQPNKPFDGGDVSVSDTTDSDQNKWWMMRMDPKTFIISLMDWSSSVTKQKTNWIITCSGMLEKGPPSIRVMEQAARKPINYGTYIIDTRPPTASDSPSFEFLSNNMITVFQRQLITQGISSVSEKFYDRWVDVPKPHDTANHSGPCVVHVHDENTDQKWKAKVKVQQAFDKPYASSSAEGKPHEWSTSIMSVPQFTAGDLGITYDKYIDGRARQLYLDTLYMSMRIKVRVTGDSSKELAFCHNLGSKLKLGWITSHGEVYFLGGDWLVYGFHHIITRRNWMTDLYCYRLDWNAKAREA
jgi:hypothetical protein